MSTASRVIKNTGFLYARMGITMFVSLYTTRLVLNALGATDFGIFNVVGGAIAMLGFLNASMAAATQRFMSYAEGEGKPEKKKSIFNISVVLHVVVAVLAGIALLIAGYFFFNGVLNIPAERVLAAKVVYGSLIVSTMFTVMTVPYDAVLNAHENMKYYAIVGVIESLLKLGIAFVVVYTLSDKLILYGVLMAAEALLVMVIMRIYCHRKYEECVFAPRKYWHKGLMREMVSFGGWNLSSVSISMISSYGQGIILNHFFGAILNAAQGIANQINGQIQGLSANMLKALNPVLGKSAGAKNNELLLKSVNYGAKYSTILFTVLALPIFIEGPYIMKLWLKNVPEWTIIFVRYQLLKGFVEFQFCTLPTAIGANGRIKEFTIWSTISNFLQLPIIYVLFNYGYPPYYMYIVTIVFGNIIVYAIAMHYLKRYCNLSIKNYIKDVLLPIYLIVIVTTVVLYLIKSILIIDSIASLIIFVTISTILFLTLYFFIGCKQEEKNMLFNLKDKLFNKKLVSL